MKNDNALLVEVINCIMSDISPHTATEKCMENLMMAEPSYEEMDQCHSSEKGENLLHDFGVQTEALNPSCYFIPWITIDNVQYSKIFTFTHTQKKIVLEVFDNNIFFKYLGLG